MSRTQLVLASFLLAGSFGSAGVAYAAEPAMPVTAVQKAELAQLNPKLRKEVESRLGHGQTVRGVLDTMLLNNISHDFADGKIVATDFDRGTLVVANKDGVTTLVPFDVETLAVKK